MELNKTGNTKASALKPPAFPKLEVLTPSGTDLDPVPKFAVVLPEGNGGIPAPGIRSAAPVFPTVQATPLALGAAHPALLLGPALRAPPPPLRPFAANLQPIAGGMQVVPLEKPFTPQKRALQPENPDSLTPATGSSSSSSTVVPVPSFCTCGASSFASCSCKIALHPGNKKARGH